MNNENDNIQQDQSNPINMDGLRRAALGSRAVLSDMSDFIVKKARTALDDNAYSSAISGITDTLTGKRLSEMSALKGVELQDKLGNIIFRSNIVTTGGKIAGWVEKNSPIGTAGTTLYGLYKDTTKYSGLDMAIAMGLTGLATAGGLKTGKMLDAAGATTATVLVVGGGVGTAINNVTDKVKDKLCNEDVKEGRTDLSSTSTPTT
ncbi:hypothetical protein Ga0466249_004760 [Sporomusaceae bacterium BoRhaA]|uniref:hypothetical protein n=1 Tax=Pelorhabdus rhamnosifermentans TaxID=2772457 RepID=UPI001C061D90|nr:hypothetical protein [Pelorhabdus rhamnosifermentans]MBU2703615.1 hypothetical protein [Pelorhabdus rhamnosifermentans]